MTETGIKNSKLSITYGENQTRDKEKGRDIEKRVIERLMEERYRKKIYFP